MHDIKAIREAPELFDRGLQRRGLNPLSETAVRLDQALRAAQTALQAAQSRRNDASKLIGAAKARKDEAAAQALMSEVEGLKAEMAVHFEAEGVNGRALKELLSTLPNLPADDVPDGPDESANAEIRRHGDPAVLPAAKLTTPQDHVTLGEGLGGMDFEAAAKMSGARFVVLKKDVARLERAIGQFMLDLQTLEHGYTEVSPPILVQSDALFGTGQLPKFAEDLFRATTFNWVKLFEEQLALDRFADPDFARKSIGSALLEAREERDNAHWLIPTAEVSLTNLVRESIVAEEELPLRLTALTPCFRAEAGASGRDTRGMIRQHQFYKVELVSITTPEQSEAEHERMTGCAEEVLKRLGLPFRTMLLCAGDMGFSARKTYDLEVWLPSQGTYREISSCSNCGDFQARRMEARCRRTGEKGGRFVHTLNGSGLAVGRTLVAILENYQDEGGRIAIPAALQPYMTGKTHLEPAR